MGKGLLSNYLLVANNLARGIIDKASNCDLKLQVLNYFLIFISKVMTSIKYCNFFLFEFFYQFSLIYV